MFRSADSVGWAASKLVFVFFFHFVAEGRTFFLTSQPDHQKNHVFLKVQPPRASNKTGTQKKVHFVAAARHFFLNLRFRSPATSRKLACQSRSIEQGSAPSHRGTPSQKGAPSHTGAPYALAGRCICQLRWAFSKESLSFS